MADIDSLTNRIDAEFSSSKEKLKTFQKEQVGTYQERQKRLQQLEKAFEQLSGMWKPRLEVLVKKFGDKVKATPKVTPSRREGIFEFKSNLASVRLRLSASTDPEVTKVILNYDLEILPILMQFESHSELALSLDAVDMEAAARWLDDRLVSFVQAYLSLHENEYYLKDHMVEDPVIGVRFPKFAAAATLEWSGKTYYFVAEDSRREFEKQQKITSKK